MATDQGAQLITIGSALVLSDLLGHVHEAVPARDCQPRSQGCLGHRTHPGSFGQTDRQQKAYAGSAPVTRASGKSMSITRRRIKNDRLAAAGWIWAFGAATHCQPASEHYRRRRELGDRHAAAQRNHFNKLTGQLFHYLQDRQAFDEAKAFELNSVVAA